MDVLRSMVNANWRAVTSGASLQQWSTLYGVSLVVDGCHAHAASDWRMGLNVTITHQTDCSYHSVPPRRLSNASFLSIPSGVSRLNPDHPKHSLTPAIECFGLRSASADISHRGLSTDPS